MRYISTFETFLETNTNSEDILGAIYTLSKNLKSLHSNGKYAQAISFSTVGVTDDGDYNFMYVDNMPTENKELYIQANVDSLTKFALGTFVYLDSHANGYVPNVQSFDYSLVDPSFIIYNQDYIKSCIPQREVYGDYFDSVLAGGNIEYFSDYADKKKTSASISSGKHLSYSTAAGRAYAENKEESAFIQALYYPILGVCIAIISIIVYLLILIK